MKLVQTQLFRQTGIDVSHLPVVTFRANDTIEQEGSVSTYVGVIIEGTVVIQTYTVQGTPIVISTLTEGMEYGDVLIYGTKQHVYPGNVVAKGPTTIAMIPNDRVQEFVRMNPTFSHNFLTILSDKVLTGTMTSKLLSQDTIRDKILYYLAQERIHQKSNVIELGMTKEDWAKILHVTRPSLSRELIHMKQEGLLDYTRQTITLLQ